MCAYCVSLVILGPACCKCLVCWSGGWCISILFLYPVPATEAGGLGTCCVLLI